jgi:hypothetical protein
MRIVKTPVYAPRGNAIAERRIASARRHDFYHFVCTCRLLDEGEGAAEVGRERVFGGDGVLAGVHRVRLVSQYLSDGS